MKCGVCGQSWAWSKTELSALEDRLRLSPGWSHTGKGWTANYSKTWACSHCIASGYAIAADPAEQDSGGYSPTFLAYWNKDRVCAHCGSGYVFGAEEQRLWYEQLKFHTRSQPIGCVACRKRLRRSKVAHKRIGEELRALNPADWEQLARIGRLYLEAQVRAQAVEFLRRAKNRCPEPTARARLVEEIELARTMTFQPLPARQFRYLGMMTRRSPPSEARERMKLARPILSDEGRRRAQEILSRWWALRQKQ
ncbi:MAG: zinc-ribbon domain containing protein [Vulcanimicrobiota bacterium]